VFRDLAIRGATRLASRPILRHVNEAMLRLAIRGLGFECSYGTPISFQEQRFLRRIAQTIRDSPTVFDVGANLGFYSSAVRKAFPGARIFAFEPNVALHAELRRRTAGSSTQIVAAALGEGNGTASLFTSAGATGANLGSLSSEVVQHTSSKFGIGGFAARDVAVRSLDSFASDAGIDRIDLLKIDTEGHERAVLAGASQLIRERGIRFIQMEFNECSVFSRVQFRDLADALPGYRIGRLLYSGEVLPLRYDPKWCESYHYQLLVAEPE
jgi:FkbM family methyltransferase